ncbi:hypothetical protein J6590_022454 [Homalodisca vitripennis]|nr:hypothetical protein J6590_022454 [Homalodisca vitripennis]
MNSNNTDASMAPEMPVMQMAEVNWQVRCYLDSGAYYPDPDIAKLLTRHFTVKRD